MSDRPADDVLVCRSIVRQFREGDSMLEVLSGVDLAVRESERLAIIGASGSGKTTLLQIMGGLDDPTSGELRSFGILFVPQFETLFIYILMAVVLVTRPQGLLGKQVAGGH